MSPFLFDCLIYFIIIIKLAFLGLAIYNRLLIERLQRISTPSQHAIIQKRDNNVNYWKNRVEFIFTMLMSIVLIYLFYPRRKTQPNIDGHVRILLFLYGIITIFTADWDIFFDTSIFWSYFSGN